MKALVFSSSEKAKGGGDDTTGAGGLRLALDHPLPASPPPPGEATVRVLRAGICATDLEIVKGYVPGFEGVLGHEFVGEVVEVGEVSPPPPPPPPEDDGGGDKQASSSASGPPSPSSSSSSSWLGARVVADINCRPSGSVPLSEFHENEEERRVLARNHEPGRTVLGIVGRDGALAEFVQLPVANLHRVPAALPDRVAAFAEPLAAALRVVEQGLIRAGDSVAVVGDGRLGLLVAAALSVGARVRHGRKEEKPTAADDKSSSAVPRLSRLVHFGRRPENLGLVPKMGRGGEHETVVVPAPPREGEEEEEEEEEEERLTEKRHAGAFDVVVEASGSSSGVRLALHLCRPLGTVVLKTTCAPPPDEGEARSKTSTAVVHWASVANDAVVNEKRLVGSRCGPVEDALAAFESHPELVGLADAMVRREFAVEEGVEALRRAAEPGALKVQVVFVKEK